MGNWYLALGAPPSWLRGWFATPQMSHSRILQHLGGRQFRNHPSHLSSFAQRDITDRRRNNTRLTLRFKWIKLNLCSTRLLILDDCFYFWALAAGRTKVSCGDVCFFMWVSVRCCALINGISGGMRQTHISTAIDLWVNYVKPLWLVLEWIVWLQN